jgi:DNA uptake protein ComE-like DNA-binding protein
MNQANNISVKELKEVIESVKDFTPSRSTLLVTLNVSVAEGDLNAVSLDLDQYVVGVGDHLEGQYSAGQKVRVSISSLMTKETNSTNTHEETFAFTPSADKLLVTPSGKVLYLLPVGSVLGKYATDANNG